MATYTLKCDVTQNGNGFDNPSKVSIRKRPSVAAKGTLMFPNLNGKFSDYFASTDLIRVYLGLDELDGIVLTGQPYEIRGRESLTIGITDLMATLAHDTRRVWKYDNFDGFEAGIAIRKTIEGIDDSVFQGRIDLSGIKGTDPKVIMDDTLRFADSSATNKIITEILNRCWDTSEYPKVPLGYTMYMSDTRFNMRKKQRNDEADAVIDFANVSDLFSSLPTKSIMPVINKATVFGAKYKDPRTGEDKRYVGSHQHQSAISSFGIQHKVFKDASLTNIWQCQQKAARIVMASKAKVITSQISVPNLLMAIPDVTVISVDDSKFGISGNNTISELAIDYGGGSAKCNATLNNIDPVLVNYL